jgi:hypothetical protein
MMPGLIERVAAGWTKVPNHNGLEMFVKFQKEVPILAFKKNGKEVYLHVYCNEFMALFYAMEFVINLYAQLKLGESEFIPTEKNWIHSIPLSPADLDKEETLLIHQLAHSLFYTVCRDYEKRKGR